MRKVLFGAVAMTMLVTSQSYAGTIDFRNPIWNPGGANARAVNGVTVTAEPGSVGLFWAADDGFGIDGGTSDRERDEINNREHLLITFADPFALAGVLITDLFEETVDGVTFDEIGEFRINGGEWEAFSAFATRSDNPNGEVFFSPPGIDDVTTLEFRADTLDGGRRNDFSVAVLEEAASVPEPASLLLLGSGCISLAYRRRRAVWKF